jgi:hypothetical protein
MRGVARRDPVLRNRQRLSACAAEDHFRARTPLFLMKRGQAPQAVVG